MAREKKRRRKLRISWGIGLGLLAVAIGLTVWLTRPRVAPLAERFRTAAVTHGDLVREVRATGHVEAVSTVSVGAEISGRLATVEVDYNDHVSAGQVLARFDRKVLEAQRAQSAALASAASAQFAQARFDLAQAKKNAARGDALFASGAQAQSEHDALVTALALAKARVEAAEANVSAQKAMATVAATNLGHAIIRAPIDGVIITRNVDPGQTVASMLQTPVLFTVAADLRKMEVVAAVDEADIAELAPGELAQFTVNAYQDRIFNGTVTEVRNAAQIVQDVVTYGVVIVVDNLDLALKPSMTASVRIRTGKVADTDKIPSAALRFTPPGEVAAAAAGVWLLEPKGLVRKSVHPALTDGELTAIAATDLPAGSQVIVDLTSEGKKAYDLTRTK
jgi:HlyD family secretion protein